MAAQQPTTPSSAGATPHPQHHRKPPPWPIDIVNGMFRGDYTPRLGVPGHVTQAVLSFVPGVGTICAFRDYFACRRKKDSVGAVLNFIAFVPTFVGIPKTIHVVRNIGNMSQLYVTSGTVLSEHHQDHHPATPAES